MPFTPTHALAAVPFARIAGLSPAALAIGAMLPDIAMFFPGTPPYNTTHGWLHGPISCLPYGLCAFVLFRLCRGPAIGFAPDAVRARLAPYARPDLHIGAHAWLMIALSLVLGVWTHILWDSFTHGDRFGSELFPALMKPWLTLHGLRVRGYQVLQHGSSIVGLPLLALVVARWYRRQPVQAAPMIEAASNTRRALAFALVVIAPLIAAALGWQRAHARPDFLHLFAYRVVTGTGAAYALGFVLLTLPQQLLATKTARFDR